jgi:hypothetical protein
MNPKDALAELGDWLGAFYMGLMKHGMAEHCAMDLTTELLHIMSDKVMEVEE